MAGTARERWSSRTGFVLAAVGSAVGLGNMWRFSYLTAENGGAAFVILYLAITAMVGLPILLAELQLGRGSQQSPVQALAHFGGNAWKPLGFVFVAAGFLILAYYGVVAGWTVRYAATALATGFDAKIADDFVGIAQGREAFALHVVFMAATIVVVAGGVKGGIERTAVDPLEALIATVPDAIDDVARPIAIPVERRQILGQKLDVGQPIEDLERAAGDVARAGEGEHDRSQRLRQARAPQAIADARDVGGCLVEPRVLVREADPLERRRVAFRGVATAERPQRVDHPGLSGEATEVNEALTSVANLAIRTEYSGARSA